MRNTLEYKDRLLTMRNNVYIDGQLVGRDDPRLQQGINVIAATFDAVNDPELKDIVTATSHLSGETISRFTHIHQSAEDLMKKQDMTRKLCHLTGGCIHRCMGIDALNALSVVTRDTDDAMGTEYNKRFLKYLQWYQENELVGNCAQTDVKGDRSLRPHQQPDLDLYLRVVEKREDGIIVRGAKAHNTMAPYADEIIVLPTRAMTEKDADWAVAFAIPADTEGLYLSIRASSPRARKELKAPIENIGMVDSFTIFDDVFVPWDRVFLCGEHKFAGELAIQFATYHRHSYTGCKPAITDVLLGATALVAEYNGIEKAQHVRDKLTDMVAVGELVYAAGVASAVRGTKAASGTMKPNPVFANVGRYHAGINVYHEYDILADIAGGLPSTLPYEGDFYEPKIGPLLHKYMMRKEGISLEDQHRCFRLISDLAVSAYSGVMQVAGLHGGGSPIMEKIAIIGQADLNEKKNIAKRLAGIEIEK